MHQYRKCRRYKDIVVPLCCRLIEVKKGGSKAVGSGGRRGESPISWVWIRNLMDMTCVLWELLLSRPS